ncbi:MULTISPECIES: marine proteobacterial sortase target protein [unclassified Agarivorans]|uniref:marine proteobacterial sortase target protein n=1 Tax=unclassified Agarivorans TaxID=2636026 RepID=UPI0026E3E3DC|nr:MULTISPECIES: marine proteobacterial sortase target protein [unclassified Agarivorans]MDO6684810.1 marine proteobacterial sortase target protein [Agarivorans sp. 3_MG-2023]MDO6715029.1 marine proteobacterial sortase target protein [Agarivorans sp. 2_MG-2023]
MKIDVIRLASGFCHSVSFGGAIIVLWAAFASPSQAAVPSDNRESGQELSQGSLVFIDSNGQRQQRLPLHTKVEMTVSGMTNRVTLIQTFENNTQDWINGRYMFPLPNDAAVDQMHLIVGDREIEGEIQEKKQAKRTFDTAKQEGKRASLVEQLRPNIFTTAVANLGPNESLQVKISYQQQLAYQDGEFSLRFPMVVNPRYTPQIFKDQARRTLADDNSQALSLAALMEEPYQTVNGNSNFEHMMQLMQHSVRQYSQSESTSPLKASLHISLSTGFELDSLQSVYHPVSKQVLSDGSIDIRLLNTDANRDFLLKWKPVIGSRPEAAVYKQTGLSHQTSALPAKDDYALLMLMPPQGNAEDIIDLPRELILVIDTSGSMSGESMAQAREALLEALRGLAEHDYFNLIEFNSNYRHFLPQSVPASSKNIKQARGFVNQLQANGGTEMFGALQAALKDVNREQEELKRLRQVIFITDGAVSNESALFELITNKLGNNRLFTIGIGSAPNSHFMQRAAELGKGTFTYIGKQNEVKQKVTTLFKQISHPVVSDVQLSFSDGTVPEYWPANIPDLYLGQPLMVSIKMPSHSQQQLVVSGNIGEQFWQRSLNLQANQSAAGLDLLWARQYISALELSKSSLNQERVEKQVLALALKYHLVSSQTSLVAVDLTPAKPLSLDAINKQIDGGMPLGWQAGGILPQTSTSSRLNILIGYLLLLLALGLGWRKTTLSNENQVVH